MLTASRDDAAQLWPEGSAGCLRTFEDRVLVKSFSPAGPQVLTASDSCALSEATEILSSLRRASGRPAGAHGLPRRRRPAVACKLGRYLRTFEIRGAGVISASFSPDGPDQQGERGAAQTSSMTALPSGRLTGRAEGSVALMSSVTTLLSRRSEPAGRKERA